MLARSSSTSHSSTTPLSVRRYSIVLGEMVRETTSWITLSTRKLSGVTSPDTTASPKPHEASMAIWTAVAIGGVEREGDACRLGLDHLLDPDAHRDDLVVVARLVAVGNRAVGEDRRPAPRTLSTTASAPLPTGRCPVGPQTKHRAGLRPWPTSARRRAGRRPRSSSQSSAYAVADRQLRCSRASAPPRSSDRICAADLAQPYRIGEVDCRRSRC